MHCLKHFWNSHVALSTYTTKTRVYFLLGFEDLAVDFVKFSNAGEAFFIRFFTDLHCDLPKAQSIYWLFPAKPELKLGHHFVDGRIVNVTTVVSLRHRRKSSLVKSVCETALGLHLCTRIWVCVMIGFLKKPLSICQSGWKEIWHALPVIRCVRWGTSFANLTNGG